jgi:ATP-dependent helicase/nuclease subunit B
MPPNGDGTPLDTEQPIAVGLANQKSIRVRGRVDRIDRLGTGAIETYAIWDYKSGSTYGYDANDPMRQGRKVQPYLYATIVAHRLREAVSAQSQVAYFGFFFPGIRAIGRRLQWTPEQLAEGAGFVDLLCQTVAQGAFVPTTDHAEDFKFCDYRTICGDTQRVASWSQAMLKNSSNTALEPFRKLRGIDTAVP